MLSMAQTGKCDDLHQLSDFDEDVRKNGTGLCRDYLCPGKGKAACTDSILGGTMSQGGSQLKKGMGQTLMLHKPVGIKLLRGLTPNHGQY